MRPASVVASLALGLVALPVVPRVTAAQGPGVELLPARAADERAPAADPKPAAMQTQVASASGAFGRGVLWVATAGGSAGLLRWTAPGARWTLGFGVRGGVASLLDLATSSSELLTTDYYVALPVTVRRGGWATSLALWHESSHIGDEFAERTGRAPRRIAHDQLQLRVVRSLRAGTVYAGAHGAAYRWAGADAGNVSGDRVALGGELRGGPARVWGAELRPLLAVDEQRLRGWGWAHSTTVAAGVELTRVGPGVAGDAGTPGGVLRVVVTAHDGVAPWWQFGGRGMRWLGAGVQWEP